MEDTARWRLEGRHDDGAAIRGILPPLYYQDWILSPQELKNCKPMNWQQFYTALGVRMTHLRHFFIIILSSFV